MSAGTAIVHADRAPLHDAAVPEFFKSTPPRMEQVTTSYRLLQWPEYRKSDTSLALTPLVAPQVGYAQYTMSPPFDC